MKAISLAILVLCLGISAGGAFGQRTEKPVLHGRDWVAITGKPLAATAGAMIFAKGGNAVDAACAMLGAVCTMYDVLSWGGETQALIYNPKTGKVVALNALGVAPTGATAEFYKSKGYAYPPEYGVPLAAVTPGTPGGLLTMLAEFGTMSLAEVLAPAMRMAEGYPMDKETADRIEKDKDRIKAWPYSRDRPPAASGRSARRPRAGEIFRQPDLAGDPGASWSRPSVRPWPRGRPGKRPSRPPTTGSTKATSPGSSSAARRSRADSSRWRTWPPGRSISRSRSRRPIKASRSYKLTSWVQGPVMLQALNMLENLDLKGHGLQQRRATSIRSIRS